MAKAKSTNTNKKKYRIIGDIFVLIMLVISVTLSVISLLSRTSGDVPHVFGYTLATIQSGSMEASGFNIGDKAVLKRKAENLAVGDIIAFRYCIVPDNPAPNRYIDTVKRVNTKYATIIFHEVIDTLVDDRGVSWYLTKGSSNPTPDAIWIRHDLVIGKHAPEAKAAGVVLETFSNKYVMLALAIVPTGLLMLILLFQLISYLDVLGHEKRLLKGELSAFDKICVHKGVARGMKRKDKIKLYLSATESEKDEMAEILWGKSRDYAEGLIAAYIA